MRLLVVEDEKKIANLLKKGLVEHGYLVELSGNGDEAFHLASTEPFDAMVLDIMLPGRDGLSIVRQLRERKIATPVLLLTARGEYQTDTRPSGVGLVQPALANRRGTARGLSAV